VIAEVVDTFFDQVSEYVRADRCADRPVTTSAGSAWPVMRSTTGGGGGRTATPPSSSKNTFVR
jgi:hypothetical protein